MSNLNNWLTPRQENAIFRLAWDKHLDSESLSMRRFSKKVADLTRIEASTLIDYMRDCEPEPLPVPDPLDTTFNTLFDSDAFTVTGDELDALRMRLRRYFDAGVLLGQRENGKQEFIGRIIESHLPVEVPGRGC